MLYPIELWPHKKSKVAIKIADSIRKVNAKNKLSSPGFISSNYIEKALLYIERGKDGF
jgi:hypothetical protein